MSLGDYIKDPADLWKRKCAQVIDQVGIINGGISTGDVDAYILNLEGVNGVKPPIRLLNKQRIYFTPHETNTGACTIELSEELSGIDITKADGITNPDEGEIVENYPVLLEYDTTEEVLKIISNAYDNILFEKRLSSWTPTVSGSGTISISNLVVDEATYQRLGGYYMVRLCLGFQITGTGTQLYVSLPFSTSVDDADCEFHWAGRENATELSHRGAWFCDTSGRLRFIKRLELATFTAGAGARITMQGLVRAA